MKYDHAVKSNGQYYKAGEEVPGGDTGKENSEAKGPGRPKKAAGQ